MPLSLSGNGTITGNVSFGNTVTLLDITANNVTSNTIYTNSKVGIGNTYPVAKVHIDGAGSSDAKLYIGTAYAPGSYNTGDQILGFGTWSGNSRIQFSNHNVAGAEIRHYSGNIIFAGNYDGSGSERMRIDSSGRVTKPYQPAFFGYKTSEQAIGSNSYDTVAFGATVYNVGNHFNTSTSIFTVPVTGLYQFNFGLYIYPVIYIEMHLYVNNSQYQRFQPASNSGGSETNPNGARASTSVILAAGDAVKLVAWVPDAGGIWNGGPYSSYFQGYLVG